MRRPTYFFTHVRGARPQLAARLSAAPPTWLPAPASELPNGTYGIELRAEGLLPVGVTAEVAADGPVTTDDGLVVWSLRWQAERAARLFPVLSGDLELAPINGELGRLALAGSYRPPLSVVGGAADQIAGRHVAEAVVRRFVLDVAARLEQAPTLPP